MSTMSRLISAVFTAAPGFFFCALALATISFGKDDWWWGTYLYALIVLVISGLGLGFFLPLRFRTSKLRQPWMWIMAQGSLAWLLALLTLGLLNMTFLCIGQDNSDGNNNLGMCIFMTILSGSVYTPLYLSLLVASSLIGHGLLSSQINSKTLL